MIISRRGAAADHGESKIELSKPTISWNTKESCLVIQQHAVKDFSTKSKHSYTIRLNLAEINGILCELADGACAESSSFEKELEPSLKAILRLQAVVGGIRS